MTTQALDPLNAVVLTVNGQDYGGWLDVSIGAGIERQARDFTVGVTRAFPGAPSALPPIVAGDAVTVSIGPDRVLTGWVFATPKSHDARSLSFGIAGRSKTADAVDCAAINRPGQWRGATVLAIARALMDPYGLEVVSEVGAGPVIVDHTLEPGETVFESLDRLLKLSRWLSSDDGLGRVCLLAPGSAGRAADSLRVGDNVLSVSTQQDFAGVFSEYRVIGQSAGSDTHHGAAASEVEAMERDERVQRRRVLVVREQGNLTSALAQQRAHYERETRLARALVCTVVVQGWRQRNGQLWRPNQVVRLEDEVLGLSRDMLIAEVTYKLDGSGMVAELSVGPPEAYLAEPPDPESRRKKLKKRKKGGKDEFEYLLPADWEKKP